MKTTIQLDSRSKREKYTKMRVQLQLGIMFSVAVGALVFFIWRKIEFALISLAAMFIVTQIYFIAQKSLRRSADIKKMEQAFPDFIDLMASNLRAGITIDKSLLLSSRKEFAPLDKEILTLGKDIVTGKEVARALHDMGERIGSEKIRRTIQLIISGIRSGGNLAVLLEETAVNMREREFVEKRAASNVLMYVIFIFFAVAVGAPALFAFSSVLVEILTKILGNIPITDTAASAPSLPFALTKINVSTNFIFWFAIVFLVAIDVLASLVLGIVNKGKEKEGLRYAIPLIIISVVFYLLARVFILTYFSDFFG